MQIRRVVVAHTSAAVAALAGAAAHAETVSWVNPAGGVFGVALNWSPARAPDALDVALFDLLASYAVTLDGARTVGSLGVGRGEVALDLAGGNLRIASDGGVQIGGGLAAAWLRLTGGLLDFEDPFFNFGIDIGAGGGSPGALEAAGADARIALAGTLAVGGPAGGTLLLEQGAVADDTLPTSSGDAAVSLVANGAITVRDAGSGLRTLNFFATGGSLRVEDGAWAAADAWDVDGTFILRAFGAGTTVSAGSTLTSAATIRAFAGAHLELADAVITGGAVEIDALSSAHADEMTVGAGPGTGTATLLVDGALTADDGVTLGPRGRLRGSGTVRADVASTGRTDPGQTVGELTIDGSFTQSSGGLLVMELAGPGVHDALTITGPASLGGGLQVVTTPGYAPGWGDSFELLSYGSATGSFAVTALPTLPSVDLRWWRDVGASALTIGVRHVADVTRDGAVNFDDLALVLASVGQSGQGLRPDANEDGSVNFADLNVVLGAFGLTRGAPVPAPGALVGLALLGVGRRRRAV